MNLWRFELHLRENERMHRVVSHSSESLQWRFPPLSTTLCSWRKFTRCDVHFPIPFLHQSSTTTAVGCPWLSPCCLRKSDYANSNKVKTGLATQQSSVQHRSCAQGGSPPEDAKRRASPEGGCCSPLALGVRREHMPAPVVQRKPCSMHSVPALVDKYRVYANASTACRHMFTSSPPLFWDSMIMRVRKTHAHTQLASDSRLISEITPHLPTLPSSLCTANARRRGRIYYFYRCYRCCPHRPPHRIMALHARCGFGDTDDSIGEARSGRSRRGRHRGALGAAGSGSSGGSSGGSSSSSSRGWGLGLALGRVAAGSRLRTRAARDSKGERDLPFLPEYCVLLDLRTTCSLDGA